MSQKDIGNKIPIYKLKAGKEVEDYYDEWTVENKYDKDLCHIYFQQSIHHNSLQLLYLLLIYKLEFYFLYLFVTFIFAYV